MIEFSHPPFGPLVARPIAFKEFPNTYFWIWITLDQFFGNTPLEDEWEEVGAEDDSFLIVSSQLHRVAAGMNAHGPTGKFFARTEDLQFAARHPVLLAQQEPATVPPQKPSATLIGTHGLILDKGTMRLCSLEQLGEKGQEVWQVLKQGTTLIPLRGTLQRQKRTIEAMDTELNVKHELWERATVASKQLAVLYWQLHEEMKKQEALAHRQLPQTSSVLRGRGMIVPQLDPVEGVLLALSHAQREQGGWKVVNAVPTYTHERSTSTTEVTVRPQDTQVITGDITGQLWQRVRQFNDVDGDIFLAMLAQLLGTPPDARGGVWITTQQILEYRGIQPKTHKKEHLKVSTGTHRSAGHRFEDMQEIAEGMNRIRDTHITVRTWKENHKRKTTKKPTRKRVFQQESYLVTITDFIQQSQLFIEDEMEIGSDPGLAVAWYFKPGTCLETLLSGPNYRASWLLQQALHYDPYHEQWEKRLARYFTFQMRMNAEFGGTAIKRPIGKLIDELALPLNVDDPGKTKKRFEKAMRRLLQDKIISSWGPEDQYEQAMKRRSRYNWIDTWLAYEIEIEAAPLSQDQAEAIMEHLQTQRRQRQKLLLQETNEVQETNGIDQEPEEE